MKTLFELYMSEGDAGKAEELAIAMTAIDKNWQKKADLAKGVATVHSLMKEQKVEEARKAIADISTSIYNTEANAFIAISKSEVFDASGFTQGAYDSLLLTQAREPNELIQKAINKYGYKLGKTDTQIDNDVWGLRKNFIQPAPPFELGLYTSKNKVKLEDYRGKVILLTFWFPGCGPCRSEFPHFQNVINKFSKEEVAYLGINVLPEQDDYVLPFLKGTQYSFVPLRGTSEWAYEAYKVSGQPHNFLIDKNGQIVYSGFRTDGNNERTLELMIQSLIQKKG